MLPFDPKKPLYSFTASIENVSETVDLFVDDRFLYFRPKNFAPDWRGAFWTNYSVPKDKATVRSKQEEKYQKWLQKGQFFRVFLLPDPIVGENRMWEVWWNSKYGFALPTNYPMEPEFSSRRREGSFFFCEPNENLSLVNTPTIDLCAHFQKEWNVPRSDVRAALLWCDLSVEERRWRAVEWERGGREEIEQVTRAACTVETEWAHDRPLMFTFIFLSWYREERGSLEIRVENFKDKWQPDRISRLRRLFDRLEQRNSGIYNLLTARGRGWINSQGHPNAPIGATPRFHYDVAPPTQHERIEAALFLRDWLRENAPDLLPEWFP